MVSVHFINTQPNCIPFQKSFPPMNLDKAGREVCPLRSARIQWPLSPSSQPATFLKRDFWEERQTCQPQPNIQLASHMNEGLRLSAHVKEVAWQLDLYSCISNTRHLSPNVEDKHFHHFTVFSSIFSLWRQRGIQAEQKGTSSHQVTHSWWGKQI